MNDSAEPPSAAEVLAAPLSRFAGCWLQLRCSRCKGRSTWPPLRKLIRDVGPDRPVIDVARRFRCKLCRQPPTSVSLHEGPTDASVFRSDPGWAVQLDQALAEAVR